jgi:hypothetical protein
MELDWLDWSAAILLGVSVGIGELISRYRDEPYRAIISLPAIVYLIVNGAASAGALVLINAFGITFGFDPQDPQTLPELRVTRVLVAGFGAMAFFRSSFFVVRVESQDVQVGPQSFLNAILKATDTAVDRGRALARADEVKRAMKDVDWEKAKSSLPAFCKALRQNLSDTDKNAIDREMQSIQGSDSEKEVKVFNMGLLLMDYMGFRALSAARNTLEDRILTDAALDRRPASTHGGFLGRLFTDPSETYETYPRTNATRLPEPNDAGWNNTDVKVVLTATPGSEDTTVEEISYDIRNESGTFSGHRLGDLAEIPIETEGVTSITYQAKDSAGNTEWSKTRDIKIDKTRPTISINKPSEGAIYEQGADITADFACSDGPNGSGVDDCTGSFPNGSQIDTNSAGTKTFTVEAKDIAGNPNSRTVSYEVES